jgi:hypothetical protein
MALMEGYDLNMQICTGGSVTITRLAHPRGAFARK